MNFERVDSTPAATPLRRRILALPVRGVPLAGLTRSGRVAGDRGHDARLRAG